jgi:hypothetical protein
LKFFYGGKPTIGAVPQEGSDHLPLHQEATSEILRFALALTGFDRSSARKLLS